ncbi:hypothetical protein JCM9279_001229 [Rhodotorula babjevae]
MALDQQPTVWSLGAVKAIEPIFTCLHRVGFVSTSLCPRPLVRDRVYLVLATNEGVIQRAREGLTSAYIVGGSPSEKAQQLERTLLIYDPQDLCAIQLDTYTALLGGSLDKIPMLDLLSQADQDRLRSMLNIALTRTEEPEYVQKRDDLTLEQLELVKPLAQLRDTFFLLCIPADYHGDHPSIPAQCRIASRDLHTLPKDEAAYSAAAKAAEDMNDEAAPAPLWEGPRPSRRSVDEEVEQEVEDENQGANDWKYYL